MLLFTITPIALSLTVVTVFEIIFTAFVHQNSVWLPQEFSGTSAICCKRESSITSFCSRRETFFWFQSPPISKSQSLLLYAQHFPKAFHIATLMYFCVPWQVPFIMRLNIKKISTKHALKKKTQQLNLYSFH